MRLRNLTRIPEANLAIIQREMFTIFTGMIFIFTSENPKTSTYVDREHMLAHLGTKPSLEDRFHLNTSCVAETGHLLKHRF